MGVIPGDWEVINLAEKSTLKARIGWQGLTTKEYLSFGNYYLVTGTDLIDNQIDWRNCCYVDKSRYEQDKNIQIKDGDLLVTKDGTIGKIAYIENMKKPATLNSGVFVIRPVGGSYLPKYLFYVLSSTYFVNFLKQLTAGSTIIHLYQKDFVKFNFLLPPLPEQQAIAEALSDVDAVVSSLTKLISKKKKIKQGVMQELLTGEKRLEGFNGEWKIMHVSNIGKTYGGLAGKTKADFGHGNSKYIPFMNVMSNPVIDMGFLENVKIADGEFQNNVKMGDLFFNTSSETPEEVGMCSVLLEDVDNLYLNSFCFGFRVNDLSSFYPLYLSYFFRSDVGRKLMFSLAQGATRYNLSKNYFNKLRVALPGIEEQIAIANIISDMDAEIEALEQKLSKYKAIKQGMMQELLTGKIRLI